MGAIKLVRLNLYLDTYKNVDDIISMQTKWKAYPILYLPLSIIVSSIAEEISDGINIISNS